MLTFSERERLCERLFEEEGPFWHIYTDGNKMADIFCCEDEMKAGILALAVAACQTTESELITFELMNNHVHLIAKGSKEKCSELFERFRLRIIRAYNSIEKVVDWRGFQAEILEIESLKALRNEIIYVNRNAFVANPQYTPFSYPWGGGCAYFSPFYRMLPTIGYPEAGFNKWRKMTHCRDIDMLKGLRFIGNAVFIPSFCRIDIGEALFQNARSYFYSLTRNAEAFSQTAARLKDTIFLTDDEMYAVAIKFTDQQFGNRQITQLSPDQRIRTAKELHFRYNASNQQLRRILKLELSLLNELFP